jgi:DNA-directed RNA polymerase specialized sigma24 family protein
LSINCGNPFPDFGGEAKLSSRIYRIGLNTAMASFRRHRPAIIDGAAVADQLMPPNGDRQELLFAAIRQLDAAERAMIMLCLEDMSYREMARIPGITENYLGVRLNRIRKKSKKSASTCNNIVPWTWKN